MIRTYILLEMDGSFPVWLKLIGIARDMQIARWLFNHCGWSNADSELPDLAQLVESVDCENCADNRPVERDIFVLGSRLLYN